MKGFDKAEGVLKAEWARDSYYTCMRQFCEAQKSDECAYGSGSLFVGEGVLSPEAAAALREECKGIRADEVGALWELIDAQWCVQWGTVPSFARSKKGGMKKVWFAMWKAIVGCLRKRPTDSQVLELTARFQDRFHNDGSKKAGKAVEELTEEFEKHCTVSEPLFENWADASADEIVQAVEKRKALESENKLPTEYCCDKCGETRPMAAYALCDQLMIEEMHAVFVNALTSPIEECDMDKLDQHVSCKKCKVVPASRGSQ